MTTAGPQTQKGDRETIGFKRIVGRREKALLIDLGEGEPVWFPIKAIEVSETEYTLTTNLRMIEEKRKQALGIPIHKNPTRETLIPLKAHAWENERSIGIDVTITRKSSKHRATARIFFPKNQLQNGAAPLWLVEKKEREAIEKINLSGHFPYDAFYVSGLRDTKQAA